MAKKVILKRRPAVVGKLATKQRKDAAVVRRHTDYLRAWYHRHNGSFADWKFYNKVSLAGLDLHVDGPRFIEPLVWNENHAEHLIKLAFGGDVDAERVLLDAWLELDERGIPIPKQLNDFVRGVLSRGAEKLGSKHRNFDRDQFMCMAVDWLIRRGWEKERRHNSRSGVESACSLVAQTVGYISESAVRKVVDRRATASRRKTKG
jgi:hypothetical protein